MTSSNENPRSDKSLYQGDAKSLMETQLATLNGNLLGVLSQYQPRAAVRTWHAALRSIEEFINIPLFAISDPHLVRWLTSIRLDHLFPPGPPSLFLSIRDALLVHLEEDVVQRYLTLLMQTVAIAQAFRINLRNGNESDIILDTVDDAVTYFMSRRRHLLSLLYIMPYACKGTEELAPLDTLNVLLPIVELNCIPITSYHLKLALLEMVDDFHLKVDQNGARASHWFDMLDTSFLEPERASIMAMADLRRDQFVLPARESLDPRKVFSAAELRNSAELVGATYAAFGLNDSHFTAMTQLVRHLSRFCQEDYDVEIDKQKLRAILRLQSVLDPDELERLLVHTPSDYVTSSNAYEPFIDLGNTVLSNVNLLSRFLYAFKNVHLHSRRRFQIHAGFIFEDMVRQDLSRMEFQVTDIRRINRKEFDVVATLGDVIYNFQCKNNWIDVSKVESARALYVRYNKSLVNYYRRALAKEAQREHLLKRALKLERVEHYVISRFPVITTNVRVINYNQIDRLTTLIGRVDSPRSA